MFEAINNVYPSWLFSFLTVHDTTASITLQKNNLVVSRSRTETGARAFQSLGLEYGTPLHVISPVSPHSPDSNLSLVFSFYLTRIIFDIFFFFQIFSVYLYVCLLFIYVAYFIECEYFHCLLTCD